VTLESFVSRLKNTTKDITTSNALLSLKLYARQNAEKRERYRTAAININDAF
jgi:hypothetical protein